MKYIYIYYYDNLIDILEKTKKILIESKKTIYFINISNLFQALKNEDSYFILKIESFLKLIDRLKFLNSIFSQSHQILFYLSRYSVGNLFCKKLKIFYLKEILNKKSLNKIIEQIINITSYNSFSFFFQYNSISITGIYHIIKYFFNKFFRFFF